jgi:hypothetical protein
VGARLADFRIRPRTARSSDSANTTASRSWKKASPISQVSSRCSAVTDPASVVGTVAASSRMASKAGLDAIVLKLHRAFKSLIRGLVPQRQRRTRESSMCSVIRRPSLVRGGPPGDWCRVSAARRSRPRATRPQEKSRSWGTRRFATRRFATLLLLQGDPQMPTRVSQLVMRCRRALCLMSLTAWTRPRRLALKPR